MKIVADSFIPFLEGVFEPYAEVVYKEGPEICREDCLDADVLITRTRTRCGAELLEGTSVKMISTATIGTDHIDLPWCEEHGIEVYNAAGCNAGGVMDYVFSALYGVAARKKIPLQNAKLGIVGVGHVGRKVERAGRKLGFQILRCDPPRAEREGREGFLTLDELLAEAQIVTLHVPLDETTRGKPMTTSSPRSSRAPSSSTRRGAKSWMKWPCCAPVPSWAPWSSTPGATSRT